MQINVNYMWSPNERRQKQSGGREATLIALFTFRDTSFSSRGPIRCESMWDHFFCRRRSFLFCLAHTNTHTGAHFDFAAFEFRRHFSEKVIFIFVHGASEGLRCWPVEDERNGRYDHHTHAKDNHDDVLNVDACKKTNAFGGCLLFFSSTYPDSTFPGVVFKVPGYQVKHKYTLTSLRQGLSLSLPVFSGTSSGKTPPLQNRAGDLSMMVVWFLDVSKTTRVSYWKQTEAKHRCYCVVWWSYSGRMTSVFHTLVATGRFPWCRNWVNSV